MNTLSAQLPKFLFHQNDKYEEDHHTWKPLRLFNLYRLILATLLLSLLLLSNRSTSYLGNYNPSLALYISLSYLLSAALFSFLIQKRMPKFEIQLYFHVSADIFFIALLMHTSGGVDSSFGMLLAVAIAGGSVIMAGRMANLFAAIATLTILIEELYAELTHSFEASYTHAGLLGAIFFGTATLSFLLAKRIRESEALATQRGIDLANMAELNEHVIQRIESGILVVDTDNKIRLMNQSAWHMLGIPKLMENQHLEAASTHLSDQLSTWKNSFGENPLDNEPFFFRPSDTSAELSARFTRLGNDQTSGCLIFIDDTSVTAQRAQQLKLASLGRLTASIAHEVRNPLGAISHAGQLLAESPNLDKADLRLTEIIHNHSTRMNSMIENILQLSRREKSKPRTIVLNTWAQEFVDELIQQNSLSSLDIDLDIDPADVQLYMDPDQLHQVMWNLCQNALHHSKPYKGHPKVEIKGGRTPETSGPFLDVIDHGPGIAADHAQQIFEPFFTTESNGTGLGLYISKELCEINQARLNYIPVPSGGSCFRINFADPNRYNQP